MEGGQAGSLLGWETMGLEGWEAGKLADASGKPPGKSSVNKKKRKVVDRGVVMPPWAVKVGSLGRGIVYRMSKKPVVFAHSTPEACKMNGRGVHSTFLVVPTPLERQKEFSK